MDRRKRGKDASSQAKCPDQNVKRLALVGCPNVGKSALFGALTGIYATVSNYPGTTVEVSRGMARLHGVEYEVVDTPGMYSMTPVTEEESIARRLLWEEKPDVVLHVIDAKALERSLPLTFELLEAGFPVIVVLNIIDEAERAGFSIDTARLEKVLGVPVLPAAATLGRGIKELKERVSSVAGRDTHQAAN